MFAELMQERARLDSNKYCSIAAAAAAAAAAASMFLPTPDTSAALIRRRTLARPLLTQQ
jgi:hypothetical protein